MRSLATLLFATLAVAQQCYYPAGNPSNDVPCSSSGGTCCSSKDRCLSNGLCSVGDSSSKQFIRGSCTDANWGPDCFQQCYKVSYPGSPFTNTASVYICGGASASDDSGADYCCETTIGEQTGCCSGTTFHLDAGSAPAAPKPTKAVPKPVAFLQADSASSSTSTTTPEAQVTTVTSSSTTSSSSSSSSSSEATTYTTSSSSMLGNTTTSSATSAVSVGPSPSSNGTIIGTGIFTPTQPSGPAATGAAARGIQAGMGLVVLALGAAMVL